MRRRVPLLFSRISQAILLLAADRGKDAWAQAPPTTDPSALAREVRVLLTEELTKLWYPRAVDVAQGGFHENFARDWSALPDDGRSAVYQSRMTWTAAAFALDSPSHRDEFERYVRHGVAYLDSHLRDREQGGFHWKVGRDGGVDADSGDQKHVYGTAFVLYAASTAYRATGDATARTVARDAFAWLESNAHDAEHGGYFEALTRDGTPIRKWDPRKPPAERVDRLGVYYGFKSMNSHIHLLEALAEFFRIEPRPEVKSRLREVLEIVRDRIAVDPGALNLYLTRDWRATPAHDSFGHDVETAYLLVEAAEALGFAENSTTWAVARRLVDHSLDWGWDGEHGGFYDKGDVFAGGPLDMTKVWWVQAEGLNALLLMHERFGKEEGRYGAAFRKQWAFIRDHQIDAKHGGWFGEVTREGKPLGEGRKASPWKANYHSARALMNVARRLDSIAAGHGAALP